MASAKEETSSVPRRLSCTTCFDALWFCYTPVHQMQQYYRHGVFDNCSDKWNALVDCLSLKTKRPSEVQEILEAREKAKPHIWTFRTPEESSSHWCFLKIIKSVSMLEDLWGDTHVSRRKGRLVKQQGQLVISGAR